MEKVLGAEIRKRANDMSDVRSLMDKSSERMYRQCKEESVTAWTPWQRKIETLEQQIMALQQVHRINHEMESKLVDMHQQFVLKQQDTMASMRKDTEKHVWELEVQVKTIHRETGVLQCHVEGLTKQSSEVERAIETEFRREREEIQKLRSELRMKKQWQD
jgi:hypothetical protein